MSIVAVVGWVLGVASLLMGVLFLGSVVLALTGRAEQWWNRLLYPMVGVHFAALMWTVFFQLKLDGIDLLWAAPVFFVFQMLLYVLIVSVPLSIILLGVLILQLFGLLKRVPFQYNLRNLLVRWKTSSLTAVAFVLVVALLTVMLAFVNGMYALTSKSGIPENILVLADGATDELFSNLGYGDIKEIGLQPGIARDEDNQPLVSWELYCVASQPILYRPCPKCKQVVPIARFGRVLEAHGSPICPGSGTKITDSRDRRLLQVRGIEDAVKTGRVHKMELKVGQWFSQSGVQALDNSDSAEQAIQAVIGEGLSRELGPDAGKPALEVGDTFDLGPRKWVVVGILNSSGTTYDSEIWAKFQLVGQQFGKPTYTTAVLRATDVETAQKLAEYLKKEYKKPAVSAQLETTYFASLNTTNQQFLVGILVVMLIMAIGSAFGVMNTMFAAIAQRTKDIGVLRIIGYTRWQVLTSFFMEALLLAVIGGALGIALGSLSHGLTATSNIASGPGGGKSVVIRLVVDQYVLLTGVGFSLFMGCVGGLIPALSAMRLKPLESLR
ncbi:MAG: FtsX-like permease family protein [Gemmataceae bacterium]